MAGAPQLHPTLPPHFLPLAETKWREDEADRREGRGLGGDAQPVTVRSPKHVTGSKPARAYPLTPGSQQHSQGGVYP